MSDAKLGRVIFERWNANLKDKDRSWKGVPSNFEELFYELSNSGVPFDASYELVREAIAAHLPSTAIARNTYRAYKGKQLKTEKEFIEDWKKYISDCAHQAFFVFYKADSDSEASPEEKKYGNMSVKEYKLQRSYADSFPVLDTAALEKRLEGGIGNLEDFLKALDNGN